jgi:phage terminase large subunit-like protein
MASNAELETKVTSLISKSKGKSVSHSDLAELLDLLEELDRREEYSGVDKWFKDNTPYSIKCLPKHNAFFTATKAYREVLLLGGNRSGKTSSGAYTAALCATGLYPDWWDGIRFDGPVEIWACGDTGQTTRDTVQRALLGPIGAEGTGMIPAHLIGRKTKAKGTTDLYDTIEVIHTSGKVSIIGFKSYQQNASSFFGTAKHLVWLDEPCPEDIYNECLIRTSVLPGGAEGRIIHTITPKKGLTRLLADFLANCDLLAGTEKIEGLDKAIAMMDVAEGGVNSGGFTINYGDKTKGVKAAKHRAAIAIGWDDIPWMSEKAKQEILESTPEHLKKVVSQGIPSIGDGAVYTIPLSEVLLKQEEVFPIPAHYKKLYGMDVGWNRTAAVFGAQDPDTGIVYIYAEHYVEHQPPEVHAARIKAIAGDWMVGLIDPASKQPALDGKVALTEYRRLGLRLREADNAREAGIMKVNSMLSQGMLKFFPNVTRNLQNEYILYSRENGKIVKENDHALDALRYLVMGLQFAKTPSQSALPVRQTMTQRRYNV